MYQMVQCDSRFGLLLQRAFVWGLLLLLFQPLFAQETTVSADLYKNALRLAYSNPSEALKITQHLQQNSTNKNDKANYHIVASTARRISGNTEEALREIYAFDIGVLEADSERYVEAQRLRSELLSALYLDVQVEAINAEVQLFLNQLKDVAVRTRLETIWKLHQLQAKVERKEFAESIQFNKKEFTPAHLAILISNPQWAQTYYLQMGTAYSRTNQVDLAKEHLAKALHFNQVADFKNDYVRTLLAIEQGHVHFLEKQHQATIAALTEANSLARRLENISLNLTINRANSINYLAINDTANYQRYASDFMNLFLKSDNMETVSVNTAFNLLSDKSRQGADEAHSKWVQFTWILAALLVVLTLALVGLGLRMHYRKNKLQDIMAYLAISGSNQVAPQAVELPVVKEAAKKVSIPAETERVILAKLKKFETTTKFTQNEMSLAYLAAQFDTNTKYLSEIINTHYGTNFNTYINRLRINYIISKIKTDPNYVHYKISFLAEQSGFSSHSSFATVFKSITGLSPATFIELHREEVDANTLLDVV